ncbi:hypothetical protein AMS68_003679 [Peltaster fructicola]|uniref:Cobalamin-independent methionine synthase MetE C-terminal/archaeal domain-containing protein n=1 Tax=Peltaster fructicola TaxID=286661 RepID=A0A6H0XTR4_9PEZI|nr:hypothetical protein AMS68_003679 [Peltaster fructicola]
MPQVKGCLLVGSVLLPDAETVFRDAIAGMPNRLKRIPDGETGERFYFTMFQAQVFDAYPPMKARFVDNSIIDADEFTQEQLDEGIKKITETPLETGYDKAAIASYAVFKKLKDEGVIPKKGLSKRAYPLYEEALGRAIKNIQAAIPHEELSIQFDLAADTAFWEGVYLKPWFDEDPKDYTVEYISRMLGWVAPDVEAGLHNCYGDMEHKHWHEPSSLKAVSERGLRLLEKNAHKIDYFHAPIPVSASDSLDTFIAPIAELAQKLHEQGGEIYLGVVQHNDLEGTKKRIEAAGKYVPEFGIATECGMGRTPKEQIHELFKLSTEVSEPVA